MSGIDLHAERISDECHAVLSSYSIREAAAKAAKAESSGWLDRIEDVPGVDAAQLTRIHGYLIAQGYLKFEITGRSVGLQYQLSPAGRDALARGAAVSADGSEADSDDSATQSSRPADRRSAA